MIVICKKDSSRLLKNHRYEVKTLHNDMLTLKGISGRFSVSKFTDKDGKDISSININAINHPVSKLDFDSLKKGDILVCISDSYTLFAKNCMYRIAEVNKVVEQRNGWNGKTYSHSVNKIKFDGINRWIKFSYWNFRALTIEEQRENQLNTVLLGKEPEIVKSKDARKIDLAFNKNLELIKILSVSILDKNRHHLDVIDWSVKKTGAKLRINRDDFTQLLDMKLSDIIKIIDNK